MCYTFTIGNIFSQSQQQKQQIETKLILTHKSSHSHFRILN